MSVCRFIVCVVAACVACLPASGSAAAEPALLPTMPYQARKTNPVRYDVDFSVVVTPPYKAKVLKVWLPLPQSDSAQEVTEGEITSFPLAVAPRIGAEKVYGNKFAYFEFAEPQGAQIIRHKFQVTTWELHWDLQPDRVVSSADWSAEFAPYLRSESQAVVVDAQVREQLAKIVPRPRNPFLDLTDAISWVDKNLKYDHAAASLQASSLHALTKKTGHCSDYHGLCAAFGRALGYPARVTYGINPFPKNSPSHCKLEAFLPPYGWVSFDVSETQRLVGEISAAKTLTDAEKTRLIERAQARLRGGFRDNTWFLQTRGTDYELAPPATKRAAVVRTAYVEADGVALAEPDPGSAAEKAFTWMTVHKFTPDKPAPYPFKGWSSLEK